MVNCMHLALKMGHFAFGRTLLVRLMDSGELLTMESLQKEQIHDNLFNNIMKSILYIVHVCFCFWILFIYKNGIIQTKN